MIKYFIVLFIFLFFVPSILADIAIQRIEPIKTSQSDEPDEIPITTNQILKIPVNPAISQNITQIPYQETHSCSIIKKNYQFKQIASTKIDSSENENGIIINNILVLNKHSMVYTINQFNQLNGYSLRKQSMLKSIPHKFEFDHNQISMYTKLLTDQEKQNFVYILTSKGYYYFDPSNEATDVKQKVQKPLVNQISNAIIYKGFLFITSLSEGLNIFKIKEDGILEFYHSYEQFKGIDLAVDKHKQYLYVMDKNSGINVYNLKSIVETNITAQKLQKVHFIELIGITDDNKNIEVNNNVVLILFQRNNKRIIAQIDYDSIAKTFTFIRYFKFQDQSEIKSIHFINKNFLVLSEVFIGIFQTQIHPKLIKSQFTPVLPSDIHVAAIYQGTHLIGITTHQLVYKSIELNPQHIIQCKMSQKSKLEKIIYRSNLTECRNLDERKYYQYCQYQKVYSIKKMDIVATEQIANGVKILLITFCVIIIAGGIIVVIIRRRNTLKIKKMELQFEEKKRTVVPPSSQRGGVPAV